MKCKICSGTTNKIFSEEILKTYPADYYQCENCDFIQVNNPTWLEEAYSNTITLLDIGMIYRNLILEKKTELIIDTCFHDAEKFLDYGGGYGMFVRLMRDKGYNFYRQDKYTENIFCKFFDLEDSGTDRFDLLTAFELFEHFENPMEEIKKMFEYSDNILFSTELAPKDNIKNWWYIAPETGQHLSFYTEKSLQYVAQKFNVNYYKINNGLHLFSGTKINGTLQKSLDKKWFYKILHFLKKQKRKSLLQSDYKYIQNIINKKSKPTEYFDNY